MNRGLHWLILGLLVIGGGCAGYRLGPTNSAVSKERSIQVQFFENRTTEPRLPEAVNHALRKTLQQDGSFRLASQNDGDILVNGTILEYQRTGVSFRPEDTLTARDFRVRLAARVTATERATGKVVVDQRVEGTTMVRFTSDLASAERQALPLLAEDLARAATTLIAEGSW
jgi:hypothetical protein